MERNDALRVFVKNGGFVMVDHKLQEVKWLRTEFKYDHKEDDALYYVARTTFQKPDGTTGVLDNYDKAFDRVEKYEKGISAETSYNHLSVDKNGGRVMGEIIRGIKCYANREYWVFDDEFQIPVRHELGLREFYFSYADDRFHTDEFPKDCDVYDTKEDALSYNTYKIVNEDGSEYEREGINKLISLDADQRELVKQFEDICKKMEENDMVLISDYDSLAIFNMRRVANYELSEDSELDTNLGNPKDYERADRKGSAFKVNSGIAWWDDYAELFVLRKPTENGEK